MANEEYSPEFGIDIFNIISENAEKQEEQTKETNIRNEKREIFEESEEAREISNFKKIEAALFIAGRWLNMQDLIMMTDINPILIRQLIEKLIEKHNNEKSAIEILQKDNMWKMDVRAEHASMVNKLATGSSEFTRAEQETLAVIAYKQPVKQSVIIKIRGNKAYEHVKKFKDLGLIKWKKAGHTLDLNLSEEFHDYFHLGKKE